MWPPGDRGGVRDERRGLRLRGGRLESRRAPPAALRRGDDRGGGAAVAVWLAEAAAELYGPPADEVAEDEVARLVRRGTTILQNSQLTASVFGLVEREGAAWRVAAARAGAARGAAWQP